MNNTEDKKYDDIVMTQENVQVIPEQVPEPMPVEPEISEKNVEIKVRKRRTRAEIDAGLSLEEVNNMKAASKQQERLDNSINKAVDQMRERLGIPAALSDLISQQQLSEWKLRYGDLYRSNLNEQSFIWHKVKRKDYIALMTDKEFDDIDNAELRIFLRQEKVAKMCVLYPDSKVLEQLIEDNAGIAGNLSDEIMLMSGFRPISSEKIE